MFIYIFIILIVFVFWSIRDYLHVKVVLKNFSKTSTPVIKTAFNIAILSQDEIFHFVRNCASTFNCSYVNKFFGLWSFEVCRAKEAEKILGSSKHINKSGIYDFLHPFLKTGLLTSNGEKWRTRRRLLTPTFHFDILKEFFEVFKEESDKLVSTIREIEGQSIDIIPVSTQFTLNTICESAMGVKLSGLGNDGITYREKIQEVGKLLLFRLLRPWLMSDFMYSVLGYRAEMDKTLVPVHDFTKSIISRRKKQFTAEIAAQDDPTDNENIYFRSKKRRYAMMDTLLKAEYDGLIDNEGIIEETDTFTFEGHDTTSAAMTFTLLLLSHHSEAQERIFNEIQDVLQTKQELTIDDFNNLEYLDRVVKECLRIYPPVTFISRELSEDYLHDGFTQPKGTICNIHIYDVHHDPEIWGPDPKKFDPDRFLTENCVGRSNFAFIAFSAGMRNCIGQRFALLELKMMLTKLIRNFKISPVTRRDEVILLADLILRSKYPIKMKFYLRN